MEQFGWSIWFKHICHLTNNKPMIRTHVDNAKNIINDKPEDRKENPNKYGLKGEKRQYKCEKCLYSTCIKTYF